MVGGIPISRTLRKLDYSENRWRQGCWRPQGSVLFDALSLHAARIPSRAPHGKDSDWAAEIITRVRAPPIKELCAWVVGRYRHTREPTKRKKGQLGGQKTAVGASAEIEDLRLSSCPETPLITGSAEFFDPTSDDFNKRVKAIKFSKMKQFAKIDKGQPRVSG
jgi:hypothetical protein